MVDSVTEFKYPLKENGNAVKDIKTAISKVAGINLNSRYCLFNNRVLFDWETITVKEGSSRTLLFVTKNDYNSLQTDMIYQRRMDNARMMGEYRRIKSRYHKPVSVVIDSEPKILRSRPITIPTSSNKGTEPLPKFW